MTESAALREKRLELAELEAGRDCCDPALYQVMHDSLLRDLEELGDAPGAPEAQRRPLTPPIRLSSPRKPVPAAAEPVVEPPHHEVIPAVPVEKKMPMKLEPKEKLQRLLARLDEAKASGGNPHRIQFDIRALCEAQGWAVPLVAQRRLKPGDDQPAAARPAHLEPSAIAAMLPTPDAMAEPYERLLNSTSGVAAKIRSLRSQALELLPFLEDLTPVEIRSAEEQMDLLAQTLVLGGKLIQAQGGAQ